MYEDLATSPADRAKVAFLTKEQRDFLWQHRTRSGHCPQCNPAAIAFVHRHSLEGFVYVAGSRSLRLLKIGVCEHIDGRQETLNAGAYGGASDWAMLMTARVAEAGRIEGHIHGQLARFSAPRTYMKEGRPQTAQELFRCPLEIATIVIRRTVPAGAEVFSAPEDFLSAYRF